MTRDKNRQHNSELHTKLRNKYDCVMHSPIDTPITPPTQADRLTNILGAFATALSDAIQEGCSDKTGLAQPLPAALIQIGSFSGESIDRLAKNIALSQSGTTRVVQKLKEKGLLIIDSSPQDRRAIKLRLTELGNIARDNALQVRDETIGAIISTISKQEQEQLTSILERAFATIVTNRKISDYTCRYCDINKCPQECCPAEIESETWKAKREEIKLCQTK